MTSVCVIQVERDRRGPYGGQYCAVVYRGRPPDELLPVYTHGAPLEWAMRWADLWLADALADGYAPPDAPLSRVDVRGSAVRNKFYVQSATSDAAARPSIADRVLGEYDLRRLLHWRRGSDARA